MNGWGPKSSVCPLKPGKSNFFAGISRDFACLSWRCPKSLRKKVCVQFSFPKRAPRKRNTPENAGNRPFPESAFSGVLRFRVLFVPLYKGRQNTPEIATRPKTQILGTVDCLRLRACCVFGCVLALAKNDKQSQALQASVKEHPQDCPENRFKKHPCLQNSVCAQSQKSFSSLAERLQFCWALKQVLVAVNPIHGGGRSRKRQERKGSKNYEQN